MVLLVVSHNVGVKDNRSGQWGVHGGSWLVIIGSADSACRVWNETRELLKDWGTDRWLSGDRSCLAISHTNQYCTTKNSIHSSIDFCIIVFKTFKRLIKNIVCYKSLLIRLHITMYLKVKGVLECVYYEAWWPIISVVICGALMNCLSG